MKTLKTINEEFDKNFLWKNGTYRHEPEYVKSFISSQIKELLEELVPEEKAEKYNEEADGWNVCRSELQEKIKKILE